MPHAYEISDLQIFHFYKYKPAQFVEQVMDHFDLLYREAADERRAHRRALLASLDQRRAASHRRRRARARSHVCAGRGCGRQPEPRFWRPGRPSNRRQARYGPRLPRQRRPAA